jgi:hypothetical protein
VKNRDYIIVVVGFRDLLDDRGDIGGLINQREQHGEELWEKE